VGRERYGDAGLLICGTFLHLTNYPLVSLVQRSLYVAHNQQYQGHCLHHVLHDYHDVGIYARTIIIIIIVVVIINTMQQLNHVAVPLLINVVSIVVMVIMSTKSF